MERLIQDLNLPPPPMLIESNTVSLTAELLRLTAPLASQLMTTLGLYSYLDNHLLDQRFNASIAMLWKPEDEQDSLIQYFVHCIKFRFC